MYLSSSPTRIEKDYKQDRETPRTKYHISTLFLMLSFITNFKLFMPVSIVSKINIIKVPFSKASNYCWE